MSAQFAIIGTGRSNEQLAHLSLGIRPVATGVQAVNPIALGSSETGITEITGAMRLSNKVFRTANTPTGFALMKVVQGLYSLWQGPQLGMHAARAQHFADLVRVVVPAARAYARVVDGVLDLWVVLPQRDREAERRIAQVACEMMRLYTETQMDFMVIGRDNSSASDLIASEYALLTPA